jgi:hypothetical protein
VLLPEEYRAFIMTISNGGAGPDHGLRSLTDSIDEYEVYAQEVVDDDPECERPSPSRPMPFASGGPHRHIFPCDGVLLLGEIGCGGWWLLSLGGPSRGTVWSVDVFAGGANCQSSGKGFLDWFEAWLDSTTAQLP